MRKIERIYVHCTASPWGTVEEITRWHKERGWRTIGYHWLVTNIFPTWLSFKNRVAHPEYDGKLWVGRPVDDDDYLTGSEVGAHVKGENAFSLGVALVSTGAEVSERQMTTLVQHCAEQCRLHELTAEDVWGHNEFWTKRGETPKKSCPGEVIHMPSVRDVIATHLLALQDEIAA